VVAVSLGTVADLTHRLALIDPKRADGPDWDAFFLACSGDQPIQPVCDVIAALVLAGSAWGYRDEIVYLTGRPERVREATLLWLAKHGLPTACVLAETRLLMRRDGDHRPDTVTKREHMAGMLEQGIKIEAVFEDRPSVCRVWRELGLTVFQVGSGEDF
jgi:hypothetical protein